MVSRPLFGPLYENHVEHLTLNFSPTIQLIWMTRILASQDLTNSRDRGILKPRASSSVTGSCRQQVPRPWGVECCSIIWLWNKPRMLLISKIMDWICDLVLMISIMGIKVSSACAQRDDTALHITQYELRRFRLVIHLFIHLFSFAQHVPRQVSLIPEADNGHHEFCSPFFFCV